MRNANAQYLFHSELKTASQQCYTRMNNGVLTNKEFLKQQIRKLSTCDEKSTGKLEIDWSFSNNESNIMHSDNYFASDQRKDHAL